MAAQSVQDGPMPRFLPILCSTAILAAAISACGGSATTPTTSSLPAVFPVTITRSGGIAGFQDVLVVAGDGVVSMTRKGHSQRRCQLSPTALSQVTRAATGLPWARITPADTNPSFPDDMVSTVQSPAGGPVRLEDPLAGSGGKVFVKLLKLLNKGPTSAGVCAPL